MALQDDNYDYIDGVNTLVNTLGGALTPANRVGLS
jgi:hypothetical protein